MKFTPLFIVLNLMCLTLVGQTKDSSAVSLSQDLFLSYQSNRDYADFKEELETFSFERLVDELHSDAVRNAFWINMYNVYAQIGLEQYEDLYTDSRRKFYTKEFIVIAGKNFSLNDIQHGILRRSQTSWGLGRLRKWFPGKTEKLLRVRAPDHRIHFALSCGPENCPPETYFEPEIIDDQLESAAQNYITTTTEYDKTHKTARITKMFSRYRGDFGGKSGIRNLLREHNAVPSSLDKFKLKFEEYDWNSENE